MARRKTKPDTKPDTKQREAKRVWAKTQSDASRDIAPDYPPIANIPRRLSCRESLKKFGQTYNPGTFSLPCSPDHDDLIHCLEEAILSGAMHARAMPRGSGKSSWCQAAVMWGFSYYPEKFSRYAFMINANEGKADENLNDLKEWLELPEYAEDFPEISYAFLRLERDARKTLLFDGKPLRLAYKQDRLMMPMIPPPPNWPADWPLREDGLVPSAGGIVVCCGLTSKSIRGSKVMQKGRTLRPGLVLLDDVQDDEVATSPTQIERYKRVINRAIMGMAGPNKRISIVAPCTCIAPNDVAAWMLDRRQNPHFRGTTSGVLKSMPKNLDAWERYFEVFRGCQLKEDYTDANAYFLENKEELLEGAEAAWPESVRPPAIHAVQAAMHEYCLDRAKFFAEDMNQPLALFDPTKDYPTPTADEICARINHHSRGVVPAWATHLTAAIDVQARLLYYTVCAWGPGFDGAVVDYGAFPSQNRMYFSYREANPTLAQATGIQDEEGAIYRGLELLADKLLAEPWKQDNGQPLRIQSCFIDTGYQDHVVMRFCRESKYAAQLQGSKGYGLQAGKLPMSEWPQRAGERRGQDWLIRTQLNKGRLLLYDANPWKSFVYDRLLIPKGVRSALMLFGDRVSDHRMYADHLLAEERTRTIGRGRVVAHWQEKPSQDNHLFDTLVMATVAAHVAGVRLESESVKAPQRKTTAADAAAKRAAFEANRRLG